MAVTQKTTVSRYTRFVHSTKVGVGMIALLLIGVVLFYPVFRKQNAGVRISFTTTTKKEPEPTAMTHPHFQGLDKDYQPYNMSADAAAEVGTEQIQLTAPGGDILMKSGQHLYVQSQSGMFNKRQHMLTLKGDVRLSNEAGYIIKTDNIVVDVANKTATTSAEVHGQGPMGALKSYGGAMADGNNQQIVFEGPVFVTLNMDAKPSQSQQEKKK